MIYCYDEVSCEWKSVTKEELDAIRSENTHWPKVGEATVDRVTMRIYRADRDELAIEIEIE